MRKVLSMILAAAMVLGMVVCAGAQQAKADGESGSITLGIWPEDTQTEAIAVHENTYVPAFNELHPDMEAIPAYYKYSPDTYVALATAGNAPTVFESWYTEPEKLIRNGLVKDITTWDEVYEYSKIIREKTGVAGFCMQASDAGGGWHWSNIAWNFGATLCIPNEDGTYTSNLNTPEAIAAMEWVQKMVADKCVTDDPTQENWGTGFDRIGTSTAAMYIAANDAVDQPSYRGMNADEFFLAPMPAGPGGHFTLMGGTPYFFSPDATDEEVNWALDYLEIMGKSPEVTDAARDGWIADAQYRQDAGIPVIPAFPAWTGAVVDEQNKIIEEYSNVDMSLWQAYYDFSKEEGALRTEEPGDTQTMYSILNGVLQAICADPANVDIPALMEQANADYQAVLDAM